jgi:hypothetical protein
MTRILRLICLALAAVVVVQVSRLIVRKDPLAQLNLPALAASNKVQPSTNNIATNSPPVNQAKKEPPISPLVQGRVDRIVQSELLGPVMRPLPMALLGIAGPDAFLRAPSGQTGLLREGETLGEIKLLRIGTNRVLVEHEGQKKELIIFSGFGSETLLLKGKENPQ